MIENRQLLGILCLGLGLSLNTQATTLPVQAETTASDSLAHEMVALFFDMVSRNRPEIRQAPIVADDEDATKNVVQVIDFTKDNPNPLAVDALGGNEVVKIVQVLDFTKRYPDPLVESAKETVSTPVKSRALARSVSYTIKGKTYRTLADSQGFTQEGGASWYGPGFHGRKTASGEVYNMEAMTAAHKILPLGTKVEVTNLSNGKSIVVRINDRGPFHGNRVLDLSRAAARELGVIKHGVANVSIRALH